jgi:hypothetical protein
MSDDEHAAIPALVGDVQPSAAVGRLRHAHFSLKPPQPKTPHNYIPFSTIALHYIIRHAIHGLFDIF